MLAVAVKEVDEERARQWHKMQVASDQAKKETASRGGEIQSTTGSGPRRERERAISCLPD